VYPYVSGSYSVSGSQITFTGTTCANIPGKYNFSVSGTKLSFTLVSDACVSGQPRSVIVVGDWTKK
jgi:hypothetical protein